MLTVTYMQIVFEDTVFVVLVTLGLDTTVNQVFKLTVVFVFFNAVFVLWCFFAVDDAFECCSFNLQYILAYKYLELA